MKIKRLTQLFTATVISLSSLMAISLPLAHAAQYTCTWTGLGGDSKFSTGANWDAGCNGSNAPVSADNDILIFNKDTATPGTLINDLPAGTNFSQIIIDGSGTEGFTFTGNSINLTGGSITDNSLTAGSFDTFDLAIVLLGNYVVSINNRDVSLTLGGPTSDVSGSANITKQGDGLLKLAGNNTSWTGSLIANQGSVAAQSANAFGSSPTDALFNNGADLAIISCSDMTFNGHFTLTGSSSLTTGDYPNGKFNSAIGCPSGGGGNADEIYGYDSQDGANLTLAGAINLGSDVTFAPNSGTTTITGDLLGSYSISLLPGLAGKLVINSSNNASNTANGTYTSAQFTKTISDANANTVEIYKNNAITIDGSRGGTTVHNGGWLLGTGTVGALGIESGGNVGPGHSPGCINSGNLTLNGNYAAQIGGTTACTGYDQIVVTGSVNLNGGTVLPTLYNGFVPTAGQKYTIISNDGSDPISGTLSGVAEGGSITGDGVTYTVSYVGGDGNDLTLTVKSIDPSKLPGKPNTGFALLFGNPIVTLLVTILSASALYYLARQRKLAK